VRRRPPATVPRSGEIRSRRLAELVRLPRRSPLYPQLARALAAADRLHVLRSNLGPVPVRPTATTRESGCYRLREDDPVDLRVSRRHGRVPLSFLHELGHFVDHQLGYDRSTRAFASASDPAFGRWRTAAAGLPSRVPGRSTRAQRRYFGSFKELWARTYAQTVLLRSADPALERHLAALQAADDVFVWPADGFEAVAAEVECTLAGLGLLAGRRAVAA
jgi:hypothetical protein